eukprot:5639869-Pyramimonas_sp.AAC.1
MNEAECAAGLLVGDAFQANTDAEHCGIEVPDNFEEAIMAVQTEGRGMGECKSEYQFEEEEKEEEEEEEDRGDR